MTILPTYRSITRLVTIICMINLAVSTLYATTHAYAASARTIPAVRLGKDVTHHARSVTRLQKEDAQLQTTHFTREELQKTPVADLNSLFRQEQSIVRLSNSSGDANQTIVSIRGFGDNAAMNSLILVDGFPLVNPSLLAPNLNAILLADIERIDILQGSEGVMWGSQAIGGVVNIITRHPHELIANGTATFGSYNKQFYSAFLGDKFDHGVYSKGYGFLNRTHTYRDHNQQNDDGALLQAGVDYARGTFYLNLQSFRNTSFLPGALTQQQYDHHPRSASNFESFNRTQTNLYQFLSKHEFTDNWLLETRISRLDVNANGIASVPFTRYESANMINPRLIGIMPYAKITLGYNWNNSYFLLKNSAKPSKVTTQQNNLYAQAKIPLLKQLDFTVGARIALQDNQVYKKIDATSINRVIVSELGLAYYPTHAYQFFIRRAGNFRFPNAAEQIMTLASVTTLDAQTGVSYETGMIYSNQNLKSQLSLYQLALQNEIAFNPEKTAANPFGSFQNYNQTLRRGVTVTEQYAWNALLHFKTQLNYVDARFASGPYNGNVIPAVPAFNANVGVDYAWSEKWHSQYTALYTGPSFASRNEANRGGKLASYWLNNVALQYILKNYNFSFEVLNLLNQKYAIYTIFNAKTGANSYYPAAGRNYLLTAKVNLN